MEEVNYQRLVEYLTIREGILYRKNKKEPENPLREVQEKEVEIILEATHRNAIGEHLGEKTMIQKISKSYLIKLELTSSVHYQRPRRAESVASFIVDDIIGKHGCPRK
ncbi:20076_t:CDS:2 [Dentiscutata erythropus]|uniref:20076_t:CDS:1 n=1 Tax=Dentiscutata erythropus TaxID=1348616 RepID=A0A9N9N255_9GLOM|nr:20076_t:CDS:2 [Dentiscutata erythropus]